VPSPAGRGRWRILGLDPGSRFTGFGVIDRRGSRLRAVDHGRIALPPGAPLPERLVRLCRELEALVDRHAPDAAVLEALYHGVNPRSLIVLAQARGALLATLATGGVEIHEYSPAEVKTAVTGNGRADKRQVGRMVRMILGLGDVEVSADAGDALAVAICYAQRLRLDRLGRTAGAPGAGGVNR
jgi:crossover junction endodeoxyribonuclease RuvC